MNNFFFLMQVKGLSTETGRLAAQQAQQHIESSSLLDSPSRRSIRNSISGAGNNSLTGSSSLGSGNINSSAGGINAPGGGGGGNLGLPERCPSTGGIISGPPSGTNSSAGGSSAAGLGSGAGAAHHLGSSTGSLKQECDSLMHPSSSTLGNMSSYVPPMYRPISYEPLRKRALRSPYAEQEVRGSVLRDGSKNPSECPSPISKPPYHRPSSSASSTAPTEADTMHSERASPQSR